MGFATDARGRGRIDPLGCRAGAWRWDVEPPSILPTRQTAQSVALTALAAGVIVPIGEETFFRGYALTAWWRDLGPRSALIRSTIFFALVHTLNISVGPNDALTGLKQAIIEVLVIGPVGLALGWLFLRRGLVAVDRRSRHVQPVRHHR